jgi:hypothetical protein
MIYSATNNVLKIQFEYLLLKGKTKDNQPVLQAVFQIGGICWASWIRIRYCLRCMDLGPSIYIYARLGNNCLLQYCDFHIAYLSGHIALARRRTNILHTQIGMYSSATVREISAG